MWRRQRPVWRHVKRLKIKPRTRSRLQIPTEFISGGLANKVKEWKKKSQILGFWAQYRVSKLNLMKFHFNTKLHTQSNFKSFNSKPKSQTKWFLEFLYKRAINKNKFETNQFICNIFLELNVLFPQKGKRVFSWPVYDTFTCNTNIINNISRKNKILTNSY